MMNLDVEVRCHCKEHPLLAKFGVDARTNEPMLHIKSWKGDKLYVNAVITSGIVRIQCRSCGRWHRVKIVKGAPRLVPHGDDLAL